MADRTNHFSNITRYSDQDLAEFQAVIEKKMAKATRDLSFMEEQIQSISESQGAESDWVDETSSSIDRDMLFTMASRQRKHLQDLNNALLRIRNKSYGICTITGELIDKRRLLAVPTTTKSLAAKTSLQASGKSTSKGTAPRPTAKKQAPKIISKVITKKSSLSPKSEKLSISNEDWDEEDDFDLKVNLAEEEIGEEIEKEDDF